MICVMSHRSRLVAGGSLQSQKKKDMKRIRRRFLALHIMKSWCECFKKRYGSNERKAEPESWVLSASSSRRHSVCNWVAMFSFFFFSNQPLSQHRFEIPEWRSVCTVLYCTLGMVAEGIAFRICPHLADGSSVLSSPPGLLTTSTASVYRELLPTDQKKRQSKNFSKKKRIFLLLILPGPPT